MPILGDRIPIIGEIKTTMSVEKTKMSNEKVITFDKGLKNRLENEPLFSQGFYHWVMFILALYARVKEELKVDFESFVILQVVVSHSLYQINKSGGKTYTELEDQFTHILQKNTAKNSKLTFASISDVLQLPRETVRRKIIALSKRDILEFSTTNGIRLGLGYKKIYKEFVKQTTLDMSSVVKKWKKSGALDTLLAL